MAAEVSIWTQLGLTWLGSGVGVGVGAGAGASAGGKQKDEAPGIGYFVVIPTNSWKHSPYTTHKYIHMMWLRGNEWLSDDDGDGYDGDDDEVEGSLSYAISH